MINVDPVTLTRLCDTAGCYKEARFFIIKKGKRMYVCDNHKVEPPTLKQGSIFKEK